MTVKGLVAKLALLLLWACGPPSHAQTCHPDQPTAPKKVFWGDLHVHTAYSMDAYVFGNLRTPEDAYRFARGEALETVDGVTVALPRPLDFVAVTDHAEYFGLMNVCQTLQPELAYCQDLKEAVEERSRRGFVEFFLPALLAGDRSCQVDSEACATAETNLWQRSIQAAEAANEPCSFTTFIANEWTKSPQNYHWHRNLIYRGSVVPPVAINSFDQPNQEALWRALDEQCLQVEGCDVLAIPHNSNLAGPGAFSIDETQLDILPLRAQLERLLEIHQHKGSSECYAPSVLADEACAFEHMLPVPLSQRLTAEEREMTAEEQAMVARGYARAALGRGLQMASQGGVNPFRFGFIASTDTHDARPGDVAEENWTGHIGAFDSMPDQRPPQYNPGGLVAVWAVENTRDAIFDALARRETYATSGPRIRLRFDQTFGTYASCDRTVGEVSPMGSTVPGSTQRPPTFLLRALKDRAPIDRMDIVKLYVRDGEIRQSIVSFSGDTRGRDDWCVAWRDEDYRADEYALWYARVFEVPTPRWDGESMIRERAWSSPIWSEPAN